MIPFHRVLKPLSFVSTIQQFYNFLYNLLMGNSFDQSQLQRRAAVNIDVVHALDVFKDISDSSSDVDESNGSRAVLNSASLDID